VLKQTNDEHSIHPHWYNIVIVYVFSLQCYVSTIDNIHDLFQKGS